jgi:peptidoglycan hydrolase-like protein with peptidoglycan-binding domain
MEEASRPARDHYTLQLLLAYHGLMAPDARIDGSYGAGTRNAIITLQKEANLPTSGFLSNATAEFLLKKQDNPR